MVQFIPLIIVPQVFICGVIFPTAQLPGYLQWIGYFLPLTYGVDGIRQLMLNGQSLVGIGKDVLILVGYAAGLMVLAGFSIRRGTSA